MAIARRVPWTILTVALLGASSALGDPAAAPSKLANITTELVGFRSNQGVARVALFRSADGFPGEPSKALRTAVASIAQRRARTIFSGLAPGTYAVSVLHDENNNGKLDTNWLGIPREGVGASNDARAMFGPPSFEAAKIVLAPPGATYTIRIMYL